MKFDPIFAPTIAEPHLSQTQPLFSLPTDALYLKETLAHLQWAAYPFVDRHPWRTQPLIVSLPLMHFTLKKLLRSYIEQLTRLQSHILDGRWQRRVEWNTLFQLAPWFKFQISQMKWLLSPIFMKLGKLNRLFTNCLMSKSPLLKTSSSLYFALK